MDKNLIKQIDNEVILALKPEIFSIANNLIEKVPDLIIYWKDCLRILNISYNQIVKLDDSLF
jgi:Leucine-rich repeat (LRR) protein